MSDIEEFFRLYYSCESESCIDILKMLSQHPVVDKHIHCIDIDDFEELQTIPRENLPILIGNNQTFEGFHDINRWMNDFILYCQKNLEEDRRRSSGSTKSVEKMIPFKSEGDLSPLSNFNSSHNMKEIAEKNRQNSAPLDFKKIEENMKKFQLNTDQKLFDD